MKLDKVTLYIALVVNLTICTHTYSQSVGIGTPTPHQSAILELSSPDQGLLIPRMTIDEIHAITDPAHGLMVYSLDDHCIYTYNGTKWLLNCGWNFKGGQTMPPITTEWQQAASYGGDASYYAVAFAVGDFGYVGLGLSANGVTNKFYKYNIYSNTWSAIADFPGDARNGAVSFVIDDIAYVGTGFGNGTYYDDMYAYNPATNTWNAVASFPGGSRTLAVAFTINGEGYVGTGSDEFFLYKNDFYKYDPISDSWSYETSFPGSPRRDAVAFVVDNEAFIGTGFNGSNLSDFYKYEPISNSWSVITNYPYAVRSSVGFTLDTKGIVGPANGNEFYTYVSNSNSWASIEDIPEGVISSSAFVVGESAYVGGGFSAGVPVSSFFQYKEVQYQLAVNAAGEASWASGDDGDADPTNEYIHNIDLNGNILSLTDGGGVHEVDLSPLAAEDDPQVGANILNAIPRWDGNALVSSGTIFDNGFKIGIGTDSPEARLHVVSPTNNRITVETTSNGYSGLRTSNSDYEYFTGVQNGKFSIYDNNAQSERFYINSSGSIGINSGPINTQFNPKLEVGGIIMANSIRDRDQTEYFLNLSATNSMKTAGSIEVGSIYDTDDPDFFLNPSSSITSIKVKGNVQIGDTNNGAKLELIHGNSGFKLQNIDSNNNSFWEFYQQSDDDLGLYYNSTLMGEFDNITGAYTSISDRRLKTNIRPMRTVMNDVMKLQVKEYEFRSDKDEENHIGLIAQEVEQIFPELVYTPSPSEEREQSYTMDYSGLGVLAIKAIQEQQVVLDNLQSERQEMTSAINDQELRLKALEEKLNNGKKE